MDLRLSWYLWSILALVGVERTFACSPEAWRDRTPTQRMHEAEIALLGKVIAHYEDPRFTYDDDVFMAEMEVLCILKGPKELADRPKVNISEAGKI